jgi:hypothetical protein
MTKYQMARFTASDADALVGKIADITEADDNDRSTVYEGAHVVDVDARLRYVALIHEGRPVNVFLWAVRKVENVREP